jgi:branched-chain amino acid transport system substrate-binding protein
LAYVGQGEARSLHVLETVINKSGGINGRPVKFNVIDTQGNPQFALQLANTSIAKKAAAFIGPDTTGACNAVAAAAQSSSTLMYCLAPGITPAPRSYVFSAQVYGNDLLLVAMRFFKEHGWNRVALITTTDATGQNVTAAYQATLSMPEFRGMQSVDVEHFVGTDLTATAQVARIKGTAPQVVIAWANGTPFATLTRNIHDEALNVPVLMPAVNAIPSQLKDYQLPAQLYFPANQGTVLGDTPPGPARNAQSAFFAAYADQGLKPEGVDSIPWDAATLIVDGYRKFGTDSTSTQLRDWMLAQRRWPGVYGIYDFTTGSQRGINDSNALIFSWDAAKGAPAIASKAGGYL